MGRGEAIPIPMPNPYGVKGRESSGGDSRKGPGRSGLVKCGCSGGAGEEVEGELRGDGGGDVSRGWFRVRASGSGVGEREDWGGTVAEGEGAAEGVGWVNMNC